MDDIMNFGKAIEELKQGKKVCRKRWIGMKTADNKFIPWLASQADVLAEDWEIKE